MLLKNLKSFITKNTSVFIFFMLAQIVTLLGVFVANNLTEQEVSTQKSYYDNMRTYTVMFSGTDNIEESLAEVLDECDGIQHIYTIFPEYDKVVCGEYYGKSNKKVYANLGRYLSDSDISSGVKNIVVPPDILYDYSVGDTYSLNGTDYNIIGSSVDDSFHIPFNSIDSKSTIIGVCVTTDTELTATEFEYFSKILTGIFPNSEVYPPEGNYSNQMDYFKMIMFIVILLMCLGIFNLSYLYVYILEQRKRQYAVFQICGCTKIRGALIYLAEIIVFSSVAYIVSALAFNTLLFPIVSALDSMTFYAMSLDSYVFLFICYLAAMLVVFLPCIIRYTSKSPTLQYKG